MSKNRFDALSTTQRLSEGENQASQDLPSDAPVNNLLRQTKQLGKRSDPNFRQVTAYIPRDLYKKVTIKLANEEPKGEFSNLVTELLKEWLD